MSFAVVFGSLNLDYVVRVARAPSAGETVTASGLALVPGGKGANQAVAVARMGIATKLVGCTGDDAAARIVREALAVEGVDLRGVREIEGQATGCAFILVDAQGENRIAVVPGANALAADAELEHLAAALRGARALLLQLEIPLDTVVRAAHLAHAAGVRVILDPAPARELPDELRGSIDILTPNESEAALLTGRGPRDAAAAAACAAELRASFDLEATIVTLGARGAVVDGPGGARSYAAPSVAALDTTAAGDAFNGALAAALVAGTSLDGAVRRAVAAGTLCVTKAGALPSIPHGREVDALVADAPATRATRTAPPSASGRRGDLRDPGTAR